MPKGKTWREVYAPQIAAMIAEMNQHGKSLKEMKKAIREANPGYYGHHKKIWANEYMIQLGLSRRKGIKPDVREQPKLF